MTIFKLMDKQELERCLEEERERVARQLVRLEKLQLSMQTRSERVKQMEYLLELMERMERNHRTPCIIEYADVPDFFMYASRLYERIRHFTRWCLSYDVFCAMLCTRYLLKSCMYKNSRRFISPHTALSYFKKERCI